MNGESKGGQTSSGACGCWFWGMFLATTMVVVVVFVRSDTGPLKCGYNSQAAMTDPALYEYARAAQVSDPAQVAVFVTYGTGGLDCVEEKGYSLKYPERVLEFMGGKFYYTSNERLLGCFASGKYPLLEFGDRLVKDGHFSYVAFANCACSSLSFRANDTLLSSPVTECLLQAVKNSNIVTGYQVEGIFMHMSSPENTTSIAKSWSAAVAQVAEAVDNEAGTSVSALMKLTPMTTAPVYLLRDSNDGLQLAVKSLIDTHHNVCEGPVLPSRLQSGSTIAALVREYWLRGFSDSRCPLRPAAGSRAIFSRTVVTSRTQGLV